MNIDIFLTSAIFRYGIFPLGGAVLGIWLKCDTRHITKQNMKKEDLAVGIQLTQTACLTFLTLMTQYTVRLAAQKQMLRKFQPTDMGYKEAVDLAFQHESALTTHTLVSMGISLIGVAYVVRRWAWKDADSMNVLAEIALPIGVGVACLAAIMQFATELT